MVEEKFRYILLMFFSLCLWKRFNYSWNFFPTACVGLPLSLSVCEHMCMWSLIIYFRTVMKNCRVHLWIINCLWRNKFPDCTKTEVNSFKLSILYAWNKHRTVTWTLFPVLPPYVVLMDTWESWTSVLPHLSLISLISGLTLVSWMKST